MPRTRLDAVPRAKALEKPTRPATAPIAAPGSRGSSAARAYELSGPRLMSFGDAVADTARATGRDIRCTPLSAETYAAEQRAYGVPEERVRLTTGRDAGVRSGALSSLTGDVEKVLGPPRDFTDYARTAAAQGARTV
ncbi:hypothetical protein AB0N50_25690 [Streptomyces pharetrae]